ncbi:MAG: thiol-disulfide oxidoreductase DCC family protein [Roseinatronobacter sp.]
MQKTEILYNGQCPICAAEISHYRAAAQQAEAPLTFTDLHGADLAAWGLSAEQAKRRLHARQSDKIISGFPAFLVIWRELPKLRWLARLLSVPGLHFAADAGYNWIAAPLLYRLHKRREARLS